MSATHRMLVALLVLVALVLAACANPPTQENADGSEPEPGTTIMVLDEGTEPREVLRYTLESGTETSTVTALESGTDISDGDLFPRDDVETIIEFAIARTPGDTSTEVLTEIVGASVGDRTPSANAAIVNQRLEGFVGLESRALVNDRLQVTSGEIDLALAGGVGSLPVPVPELPVGVGGSWQVDRMFNSGEIPITVRATYEVSEFTDDGVILDMTYEEIVEIGQEVFFFVAPQTIEQWDVAGSGQIEISFDRFNPVSSDVLVEGTTVFGEGPGGTAGQMTNTEITMVTTAG